MKMTTVGTGEMSASEQLAFSKHAWPSSADNFNLFNIGYGSLHNLIKNNHYSTA